MCKKFIISNTSPLVALAKIDCLHFIKHELNPIIPEGVLEEIAHYHDDVFNQVERATLSWLKIEKIKNHKYIDFLKNDLGKEESEVIALALEKDIKNVIMDDLDGRRTALKSNLQPIGTLGMIIRAKNKGLIKEICPLFQKLREVNFYATDKVMNKLLILANESPIF